MSIFEIEKWWSQKFVIYDLLDIDICSIDTIMKISKNDHLHILLFNHTVYHYYTGRTVIKIKIDRRRATALRPVSSLSGTAAGERSHNTIILSSFSLILFGTVYTNDVTELFSGSIPTGK